MAEEITMERSLAVGEALDLLVRACNQVTEEDLEALLHVASMKHTMDPMLDPTRYRLESGGIIQGEKVLRAFLTFKREVKGIGFFG